MVKGNGSFLEAVEVAGLTALPQHAMLDRIEELAAVSSHGGSMTPGGL